MKTYEIVQCNQGFMVRPAIYYARNGSIIDREVYCFSTFDEAIEFISKRFGF